MRPVRPATTVPDFLVACAGATLAMAAVMAALSTVPGSVISDDTGRALARVFALMLAVAAGLFMAMALLLLRGERRRGDHYWTPLLVGAIAGVLEAWFFLAEWPALLWVPPLLLVFSLRPVRRIGASVLGGGGRK